MASPSGRRWSKTKSGSRWCPAATAMRSANTPTAPFLSLKRKRRDVFAYASGSDSLSETLMLLPEPRPTRWDFHWRMLGSELRIRPIFWASCVLLGSVVYRDPDSGGMTMFWLWIAAVLISLLVHETFHILIARFFGAHVR